MDATKRRAARRHLAAIVAAVLTIAASAADGAEPSGCEKRGFVCGPNNVEDISIVPGSDWLIASTMEGPQGGSDRVNLVDTRTRRYETVEVSTLPVRPDPAFSGCPGKLRTDEFRGHGIAVGGTPLRLYAINHGRRESIEVFDIAVDTRTARPRLTWAGCVLAPENGNMNSVTPLPEGGLAVTRFREQDDDYPTWSRHIMHSVPSGFVMEWHPGRGWWRVPDSEMSGPNGLLVSKDGKHYFVSHWGANRLVRLSRGSVTTHRESVPLDYHPDNLRWGSDGKILVTGQRITSLPGFFACMATPALNCAEPYAIDRVDPGTLAVKRAFTGDKPDTFGAATVAIDVGDELWIGNVRGTGIKIVKK